MNGLAHIQAIRVPRRLAEETHSQLAEIGAKRFEGVALWAGATGELGFEVKTAIIPKQIPQRNPDGLSVIVPGEELHRINVWLYQNRQILVAQLHTHPGRAYHSDLDDAYPIATTLGCLSIVIPDFAQRPWDLQGCAVYRLMPGHGWTSLSPEEVSQLVIFTE